MKIGDLVRNNKEQKLYCGCGQYAYAIVMSLEPFILVSGRIRYEMGSCSQKRHE